VFVDPKVKPPPVVTDGKVLVVVDVPKVKPPVGGANEGVVADNCGAVDDVPLTTSLTPNENLAGDVGA
jgi:hypothetical protein